MRGSPMHLKVEELVQDRAKGLIGQQLHKQVQCARCAHCILAQLVIVCECQEDPGQLLQKSN